MSKTRALCAVAGALASITSASAQVSFTGASITQNFDGIVVSPNPFSATIGVHAGVPGVSGWFGTKVAGNGATPMPFTADTGSGASGGLFSYGAAASPNDRALGALSSGSNAPGFGFAVTNNSGAPLTEFTITFDAEQFRSSTVNVNTLVASWGTSASGATTTDFITSATLTADPAINIVGAAPVTTNGILVPPTSATITKTFTPASPIAIGETIFFRWVDTNDGGNDAGLAIDNFTFSGPSVVLSPNVVKTVAATPNPVTTVPGDITYAITGISNTGSGNAPTPSITAAFPAGVSYNAGASILPPGATASFVAPNLTISLPAIAAGGTFPDISIVMTASVEFPAPTGLSSTFLSLPGTDSDPTNVVVALAADFSPQAVSFTGPDLTQNFDGIVVTTNPFTAVIGEQYRVPGALGFTGAKVAGNGGTAMPFAASDGSATSGGIYSFAAAAATTDRALGSIASGSNSPAFGVAITNNSGAPINAFTITFDAEQYRSSTTVTNTLVFSYGTATGGATLADYLTSATLVAAVQGDIIGDPFVGSNGVLVPPTVKNVVATIVPASPIAAGDTVFLRWVDTNDGGNDAGLAIDNFVFSTNVPATASVTKNVGVNSPVIGTVPGNVTYTFSSIANNTPVNATGAQITATFPSGVSFVSSTFPGVVTFTGNVLTVNLGNVAAGGTVPDFSVTMSSSVEFPEAGPLAVTFASTPGTDTDNTSVVIFNNTNTVQQDDLAVGLNLGNANTTLQLWRGAPTSALIPEAYNAPFIQSVEFDSKNGTKSNAKGNLLGVNFGSSLPGGVIWAFPTQSLGAFSGNVIGSFTDSTTFTHGASTSSVPASRLSGLSVAPDNSKIAVAGFDNGAVYVFDYANTGDGQATLSNGRSFNDGNAATLRTVGTTWLDETHFVAVQPTSTEIRVVVYAVSPTDITSVSVLTLPLSGASFTDVDFNPSVPAPLNDKLIVAANSSDGGNPAVFSSTVWIITAPTAPSFTFGVAPAGISYSTSTPSVREIAFGSNGDVYLQQINGTVDRVAFNSDLNTMFVANNGVNFRGFSGGTFSGMDIAAGSNDGVVFPARCNAADIAYDNQEFLPRAEIVDGTNGTPAIPGPATGTNNGVTEADYNIFFANYFDAAPVCDIANDDNSSRVPTPAPGTVVNNGVTEGDYNYFFAVYFDGCAL
ncbi:MAG: DUF11 domain-containing protein [Phycisphaerales bacterium]|nr:DUF11 domain-containing protein [Phycisphaerales bacterium]